MQIAAILHELEQWAPPGYQEKYDNAGLITGNLHQECTGILCSLDATEEVIAEAIKKGCNLVVSHHPIIFHGLKKITGKNYVERAIILAIKNDIALYAIHTNLDNIMQGVNGKIADLFGLQERKVLRPLDGLLQKLYTYVPPAYKDKLLDALFAAGGGHISDYSECSFSVEGTGSFKPGKNTHPFSGKRGKREIAQEIKIEVLFPAHLRGPLLKALKANHPYEEVAYEIIQLENTSHLLGAGIIGRLPRVIGEKAFLRAIREKLGLQVLKHTRLLNKQIRYVAICGGAGSFLLPDAIACGADFYLTSDIKYHEFFDADGKIVFADAGHWETEQFTITLLFDFLREKFPNFAVLKTKIRTNPVFYS